MIRRLGVSCIFFFLGFLSLWLCISADLQICHAFPWYCLPKPGACTELGKCDNSLVYEFEVFTVYFGPSIIFATAAYAFSKRPRSLAFWATLPVVLFVIHLIAVEMLRL
jgi:hypothetical protein